LQRGIVSYRHLKFEYWGIQIISAEYSFPLCPVSFLDRYRTLKLNVPALGVIILLEK